MTKLDIMTLSSEEFELIVGMTRVEFDAMTPHQQDALISKVIKDDEDVKDEDVKDKGIRFSYNEATLKKYIKENKLLIIDDEKVYCGALKQLRFELSQFMKNSNDLLRVYSELKRTKKTILVENGDILTYNIQLLSESETERLKDQPRVMVRKTFTIPYLDTKLGSKTFTSEYFVIMDDAQQFALIPTGKRAKWDLETYLTT